MARVLLLVVGALILGALRLVLAVGSSGSCALLDAVVKQLQAIPEQRPNQRVVDPTLADGRVARNVWIADDRYPAIIGGKTILRGTVRHRSSERRPTSSAEVPIQRTRNRLSRAFAEE